MPVQTWLEQAFDGLAGASDELFDHLWTDEGLQYLGEGGDAVDFCNAQLACAGVRTSARIAVVQPDHEFRRGAMMLATALLRYWKDERASGASQLRPVVYFGTTTGIREQLTATTLRRGTRAPLSLAHVFAQTHLTSRANAHERALPGDPNSPLPEVITVYEPAFPSDVLDGLNPGLIAIDVRDEPRVEWLATVVQYTKRRRLPLIAWGVNPLSECVSVFQQLGHVFLWPNNAAALRDGTSDPRVFDLLSPSSIDYLPILISGSTAAALDDHFRDIRGALLRLPQPGASQLLRDTIAVHWQLLRALTNLAVPLQLDEAEAGRLWGVRPLIGQMRLATALGDACHHSYPMVIEPLREARAIAQQVLEIFRTHDPPLWEVLCQLCLDKLPTESSRLIVFPSRARRRLFAYALLAYYDISEDDLNETSVYLHSPNTRGFNQQTLDVGHGGSDFAVRVAPVIVGVPSSFAIPRLATVLSAPQVSFLTYPSDLGALRAKTSALNARLASPLPAAVATLQALNRSLPPAELPTFAIKLRSDQITEIEVDTGQRKIRSVGDDPLFRGPTEEIAALLQADIEEEDSSDIVTQAPTDGDDGSFVDALCSMAVRIEFTDGTEARFAPDEGILTAPSLGETGHVEERFARAIRRGDVVVFIRAQRRQNLFSLVLNRIRGRPEIELHLALLRRWHEDLSRGFVTWATRQVPGRNHSSTGLLLEAFLRELRSRGSRLVSPGTIGFWLRGDTLAPDDGKDIYRSAEILDLPFVLREAKRIDAAANRVRSIHRRIGLRLNAYIIADASGRGGHSRDALIDEELGLTYEDIRSSLRLLIVKSVTPVQGPFLRWTLGSSTLSQTQQ